jgi:hypothetical protein
LVTAEALPVVDRIFSVDLCSRLASLTLHFLRTHFAQHLRMFPRTPKPAYSIGISQFCARMRGFFVFMRVCII